MSPAASESAYRCQEDRCRTLQVGHRRPGLLVIGSAEAGFRVVPASHTAARRKFRSQCPAGTAAANLSCTSWSWATSRAQERQLRIHRTGKPPTLAGIICGRAASVEAPSRCRCVPSGCHIHWAGRCPETGPYLAYSKPLAHPALQGFANPLAAPQAPRATRGHSDGASPAQVWRVQPKPPRCSPVGDANEVRFPEQHDLE